MKRDLKLRELLLRGYKSFDGEVGQTIFFGDITVLLGANGSGKSNLVSFFHMLNYITTGGLSAYVGKNGVNNLLYYGSKNTESISFKICFESSDAFDSYDANLSYALQDRLFFIDEKIIFHNKVKPSPQEYSLGGGNNETRLKEDPNPTSKFIHQLLSGIRTYQFHDTSETAKIKDRGYVDDAKYLRHNAGNLAAFLRRLSVEDGYKKYYERIVRHIQRVMPQFGDFELEPVPGANDYVRLNWRDAYGSDYLFSPHQISDGSLRFMALSTLLLQPPDLLPGFIVLDEPELGLHPAAITEFAGLVKAAAQKTQILLATQSLRLIDEFLPENLVVVERSEQGKCSVFRRLDADELDKWLARYSLSELWEKNIFGGQP